MVCGVCIANGKHKLGAVSLVASQGMCCSLRLIMN